MWYRNENGESTKPAAVDSTSSKQWAYIRKDFELVEATEERPEHWEWQELKIPKDALDIFQQTSENADNVDMLTECVLEMSEILYA